MRISTALSRTLVMTAIASLATLAAQAQNATPGSLSGSTSGTASADHKTIRFIKDAARDNNEEIALAEVGARKAQNPQLKQFCQMLQQDHTQAASQLQPIAQKYGVDVQDLNKHNDTSKWEKMSSDKFDQKFATEILKDHEKDINKYEKASTDLTEPDVKQFAQSMLPKLRQHMQHAETVAAAVGVDQSTISSYVKKTHGAMGGSADQQGTTTGTSGSSSTEQGAGSRDLKQGSGSSSNP